VQQDRQGAAVRANHRLLNPIHQGASSDSPYLFPGEGAELKHWQIHNAEKTLKRACVRAGVKPFTPHALRHRDVDIVGYAQPPADMTGNAALSFDIRQPEASPVS
jgi:integrase